MFLSRSQVCLNLKEVRFGGSVPYRLVSPLPIIIMIFCLYGCASTGMYKVEKTGFLRDYSQMTRGEGDQPALGYIRPGADLSRYDKILIDKVCVCLPDQQSPVEVEPILLREFADYYDQAITSAFVDRYDIVDEPGPGVLRVRAAITDVKPASPVINTISSVAPLGITVAVATKIVTDKNLGTGEAASEIEVLDSVTGERLVADVDRRQGGKMIFRGKWTDTKNAFDHWASRLRKKLEAMCSRK